MILPPVVASVPVRADADSLKTRALKRVRRDKNEEMFYKNALRPVPKSQ